MNRADSAKLSNVGMHVLTFVTAIVVMMALKWVPLTSNGLLLDDMQLYYQSLYSDISSQSIYLTFYAAINALFYEPYLVRAFYLVVMAIIATLIYSLLFATTKERLLAYLLSLLATLTPTSAVSGLFINGSYNVLFLVFLVLGFMGQIVLHSSYPKLSSLNRGGVHVFSTLSVALAVQFTSNGVLLPLALVVLPWWSCKLFLEHRKKFYLYVSSYTLFVVASMIWKIVATLDHPYAHMEGRLDYGFGSLVLRSIELIANIFDSYFANFLSTGAPFELGMNTIGFGIFSALCLFSIIVMILVVRSKATRLFFEERKTTFFLGLFLLVALVLCVAPLVPNTRLHLWHYYLPALIVALLVGLFFSVLLPRRLYIAAILVILSLSVLRLHEQSTYYDSTFAGQDKLVSHLELIGPHWPVGSTVIIVTGPSPFLSGFGQLNGLRDLNYAKFHGLNAHVLRAAIAPPAVISANLKGEDYLAGPVKLYRFSFSSGELEGLKYLAVEKEGVHSLYDTTPAKPLLLESGSEQVVLRYLKNREIASVDYVHLRSGESRPGFDYEGDSFSLSGDVEIVRRFDSPGELTTASYEVLLKSNFEGCKEVGGAKQRCPSMPFLAPPLALYQSAVGKYRIQVKTATSDEYVSFNFVQRDWHKLKFSFDFQNETLAIHLNDELLDRLERITIKQSVIGDVLLGKGYKQRFWEGDMAYFTVLGSSGGAVSKFLEVSPKTVEVTSSKVN